MITRFPISCRFIISGGSLYRTVRGSLSGGYDRHYYNEIRFFIGSLHQEVGFTGRFRVISKDSLMLCPLGSLIQEVL